MQSAYIYTFPGIPGRKLIPVNPIEIKIARKTRTNFTYMNARKVYIHINTKN